MRQINVRLTEAEYQALAVEAARIGLSPTAYLRAVAREESTACGMTYADLWLARSDAIEAATHDIQRVRS